MMKNSINKVAALGLVLASVVALAAPAQAEVKLPNNLSFGSAIFADYSSVSDNATPSTNYDATNGFHVSRAYLYLVDKVDDNITARITLDSQTAPKAAPSVFLKHAYIDYKFDDAATVEAGIGATPWVGFAEKLWGYRYLGSTNNVAGKTFADKNGILSSADGGVSVFGTANGFNYQVGAYNGEGYGAAANGGGLKLAARVGYESEMGLGAAAYYDNETKRSGVVNFDPSRAIAMIYYKQPTFTIAGEYLVANDFTGTVVPVVPAGVTAPVYANGNGFSAFAHTLVTDNIRLFGRYDSITPVTRAGVAGVNNTNTTMTAGITLIMAKGQEVTLDYSVANIGGAVAPAATQVNTLAVNLLTGF